MIATYIGVAISLFGMKRYGWPAQTLPEPALLHEVYKEEGDSNERIAA